MGMRTANFRRIEHLEKFRGRAAFSIITHDRTLDILCPTPEIMDQWVFGLRFLVGRLQPSPSTAPSPAYYDQWTIMARLRRGGFLLKFGHNGKPHERYFRVAGNMKMMFWTSGEEEGGPHTLAGTDRVSTTPQPHHPRNVAEDWPTRRDLAPSWTRASWLTLTRSTDRSLCLSHLHHPPGENPVKGVHKSVDLTAVRTVRLLAGLRNTTVGGKLGLGRWGWEDVKFGFSLLGQNGQVGREGSGSIIASTDHRSFDREAWATWLTRIVDGVGVQAIINLVAANKEEFDLWTRGMELIVHHFQGQVGGKRHTQHATTAPISRRRLP